MTSSDDNCPAMSKPSQKRKRLYQNPEHEKLHRWFVEHCRERKIKKVCDTISEIHDMNAEMPALYSEIQNITQMPSIKFNRQGKFRYWFKEIHRVSSNPENTLTANELSSKALQYTQAVPTKIDGVYSGSLKCSFNLSGHFIGMMGASTLKVCYDPCLKQPSPLACSPKQTNIADIAWSYFTQSEMALLEGKHVVHCMNVFEERTTFRSQAPSPMCCIQTSPHDSSVVVTMGTQFRVWDTRREAPVMSAGLFTSPCSNKLQSKSACCVVRDENTFLCADLLGKLCVFDSRNPGALVKSVETGFKNVFSLERSSGNSLIVQSASGRVKVLQLDTLNTKEAYYSTGNSARSRPVSGLFFCDEFFVQRSENFSLFCEMFRRPILNITPPNECNNSVMSTAASNNSRSLICSTKDTAFFVSFY